MPIFIMPGYPGKIGDSEKPADPWQVYKQFYFPGYQDGFIKQEKEKINMLSREFCAGLISVIIGDKNSSVIGERIRHVAQKEEGGKKSVEITLDRKLRDDEAWAFPHHFAAFVGCNYDCPRITDFTFQKSTDTNNGFIRYKIFFRNKLVHIMVVSGKTIEIDNMGDSDELPTSYIENLHLMSKLARQ